MKFDALILQLLFLIVVFSLPVSSIHRRILHQPLFSASSSPPPDSSNNGYDQDQPFFPEDPNGGFTQNPTPIPVSVPPPPPYTDGSVSIPTAARHTKPTKRAAIAISVGFVSLGMLSALLFYIIRCKAKPTVDEDRKQEGGDPHCQRAPPLSFLYIGTVDPHKKRSPSSSSSSEEEYSSRNFATSPDVIKHAIIPSIRTPENEKGRISEIKTGFPRRVKFGAPPPPPDLAKLQSHYTPKVSANTSFQAPPPPPALPPQPEPVPMKVKSTWTNFIKRPSESDSQSQFLTPIMEASSRKEVDIGCSSSGRLSGDDTDGTKAKLKPLHWDKVRATSDRATVWDQLKPSSFQ